MSIKKLDLTTSGYEIVERLGQNVEGGRATYKAIVLSTEQPVVIKQFRFFSGDWADFKAIEREIETLQKLSHQGIPRYLDSFDSGEGICLVQEYIDAVPLSQSGHCSVERVKAIATSVLEILKYLQSQMPPIIHRDLKPENLLIGKEGEVYLVDFGLARVGSDLPMALSTRMAGTPGFMPPEALHNLPLSMSSDLYSLGVTLICLLTGTKSYDVSEMIDFSTFRLKFQHLVPQVERNFINWLEKLIEVDAKMRFSSASVAASSLEKLNDASLQEEIQRTELKTIESEENLEISSGSQKRSLFKPFKKVVAGIIVTAAIGGIGWGICHLIISAPTPQPTVYQPSNDSQKRGILVERLKQEYPEIVWAISLASDCARVLAMMLVLINGTAIVHEVVILRQPISSSSFAPMMFVFTGNLFVVFLFL